MKPVAASFSTTLLHQSRFSQRMLKVIPLASCLFILSYRVYRTSLIADSFSFPPRNFRRLVFQQTCLDSLVKRKNVSR